MQTVIGRKPKYRGLVAGWHATNTGNHSRAAAGDGKWKREVTDRKLADGRRSYVVLSPMKQIFCVSPLGHHAKS